MAQLRLESRVSFRSDDVDVAVTMTLTVVSSVRTSLRRWTRRRDDLWAEMAVYTTQADRLDMEAILDRYSDDDTDEIRSILSAQASNRLLAPPAVGPLG